MIWEKFGNLQCEEVTEHMKLIYSLEPDELPKIWIQMRYIGDRKSVTPNYLLELYRLFNFT